MIVTSDSNKGVHLARTYFSSDPGKRAQKGSQARPEAIHSPAAAPDVPTHQPI